MKNFYHKRNLVIFLTLFLLGMAPISEESCEQGIKDVAKVLHVDFYQLQIEQMMLAYQSNDPMTGISIIEHGLQWISNSGFEKQGNMILDEKSLPKEKAIWFVRLGNLHSKFGEQDKYESYLERAVTLYNSSCDGSTCKIISKEKLIWLVDQMDNS